MAGKLIREEGMREEEEENYPSSCRTFEPRAMYLQLD